MSTVTFIELRDNTQKEYVTLGHLLRYLNEKGYIDDIEYRTAICSKVTEIRRNAVYQLMLTKESKTAQAILHYLRELMKGNGKIRDFGISISRNNTNSPEDNFLVNQTNALLHDTVIKVVFGFLKLNDVKRCRAVCRKWNAVAEPILRKQGKIVFKCMRNRNKSDLLTPSIFLDTFQYSLPNIPFTSFSFHGPWPVEEVTKFFTEFGMNVKELEFRAVTLKMINMNIICAINTSFIKYDISAWVKQSKLKKLKIDECFTKLFLSAESFASIENLSMTKSGIIVPPPPGNTITRISPTNIYLNDVDFTTSIDEKPLPTFPLELIVDFTNAKNIAIIKRETAYTKPAINLAVCQVNAEKVKLHCIHVLNFEPSTWKVNKLNLLGMQFYNTSLTVKDLTFGIGILHLSSLPSTIERLTITHLPPRMQMTCIPPLNLPNLKYLSVGHAGTDEYSFLFHFINCPSLQELTLNGSPHTDSTQALQINVKWIPRNVTKLKLGGQIEIVGAKSIYVKHLILDKCSVETVSRLITKIRFGDLVIKWNGRYDQIDNKLVPLIRGSKDLNKFLIGVFKWSDYRTFARKYRQPFEDTALVEIVDKKAQCYSFENKVGRAITCAEFNKML